MKKLFLLLLVLFATATLVSAATMPTQQYNKIYLNPFYRVALVAGTTYNYTISVNPPDGISSVTSAIVSFNAQINGQSQNFTLLVNGQRCNNPDYTIATAFSTTGQTPFYFDCSNRITSAGTYNITLRSSVVTGTVQGWLDLTYMNNPIGDVDLHGTEYVRGEDGKMFLQFLDSSQQPVNNSECFLSMWYPNGTRLFNNTLMTHLEEGIYYKNFAVPQSIGVYPASAKCYRPLTFYNDVRYNYTYDGFESNTWTGGTGWGICPIGDPNCQNGWDVDPGLSSLVTNATAGTGGCYRGNYCAKYTGSYGFIERGFPNILLEGTKAFNITYAVKFSGFQTGETIEIFIFDGNWHRIQQVNLAGGYTNNVWYTFSNYIDDAEYNIASGMLLGFYTLNMPSTADIAYVDEVAIHAIAANITISNETAYQILMGSGEVHVSELFDRVNASINTVPAQVWNYTTRTLTFYNMTDTTNYTLISQGVWTYSNRTLTASPENLTAIAQAVWTYTNRNLTYYQNFSTPIDTNGIAIAVWNATTRNLTYYPTQLDLTNYSRISNLTALDVWTYATRTLTASPENITAIALGVWNSPNRNLTYYENFSTPQQDLTNYSLIGLYVWNATSRNLTYYPAQVDLTNYSKISNMTPSDVWNYATRNLTYYENFSTPQVDMTNYSLINSGVSNAVWVYGVRSLTVDPTNYSLINSGVANAVWSASTRDLTYYPAQTDMTNYTLVGLYTWNATTRNLTYYPPQVDLTNYSKISNMTPSDVWTYPARNLTYYENFTVPQVDMTNYSLINSGVSSAVWVYTTRNLTYYPDMTNYTLINQGVAQAVWEYSGNMSNNLLGQITTGVWDYVGRYVQGVLI